jgi:hypothetical protein
MNVENNEPLSDEYLGVLITDTDSHNPSKACLIDMQTGRVLNYGFHSGVQLEIDYENGVLDDGLKILRVKGTVIFRETKTGQNHASSSGWNVLLSNPEVNIEGFGKFKPETPVSISIRFGDKLRVGDSEPIVIGRPLD